MKYILVSPFMLTCEIFNTYEEALNRKLKVGTRNWLIYESKEM